MGDPRRGHAPVDVTDRKVIEGDIVSSEQFPSPELYTTRLLELGFEQHARAYGKVLEVVSAIERAGGRALLVGGSVRDAILGKISKDFDVEVYGLSPAAIEAVVRAHGKVNEVGIAFGILKLSFGEDIDVDISLPRTDSKTGPGHTGFDVKTDPDMSIADAALRRDFTINTVAADPVSGQIYDAHGGVRDIKERRLRITDPELFADDPLRIMRGVQFVGRFGLEIEAESFRTMQEMVPRLHEISPERFWEEWKKLFLKSEKPSLGLSAAMSLGVMHEMYPQFVKVHERQELGEHGNADQWIHTLASLDEVAKIVRRESLGPKEAMVIMLATLCGNLAPGDADGGRASERRRTPDLQVAKDFLESIKADNQTRDTTLALIASRLIPGSLYVEDRLRGNEVTDGQVRRIADQIHPASIRQLLLVAEADHLGRGAFASESPEALMMPRDSFPARDWLLERARKLGIEEKKAGPVIQGRDLIAFGFKPGKQFSDIINLADDLRDEKGFTAEGIFRALDGVVEAGEAVHILRQALEE